MADGYLPPVVVRLVAETAEAIAGLERFGAALEGIGVKARAAGAEIDASMAGMAASTARVDAAMTGAGASVDRFAAQATAANERTAASFTAPAAAADRFAVSADRDAAAVSAAQERVAVSNQAMAAKMEADSAKMEAANARAVTSTAKVGTAMDGTAAKSSAAGGAASRSLGLIGLAAGAVGVETVKMASTFDRTMEQLVTMAGQPQPVVDALKQKVLALGASTGQGPDKLAEALYHLTSTGMGTDQAMHALESSAKLATMGMSDLDTTAYALAGVMSAAPKDIQNTDQAVAMMASTVGQGDMKMQDLANSIKSGLLPTMIQAGMGMRDYGATLATVTDNSMPAEMAANRLRTAVLMMEKPTKAGTAALADMRMSADQLGKDMQQGGMIQAITDLKSHMESLKPAAGEAKLSMQQVNDESQKFHDQMIQDGASAEDAAKATDKYRTTLENTGTAGMRAIKDIDAAFGGSRSAGTMLLLTDEAGKLQQKYNDMGTSVQQEAQFQQHWNDTTQQTAVKAQQAKAGLQALGIQIGEELMPAVNACLGVVARFGAALTQGSAPAKILADIIGGTLVAVVVAYTAKMTVAIAQTVAWAVTGVGSFLVGVARMVAGWGVLGESAQAWAVSSRTAAAEADAATKTAAEEMAAVWQVSLDKMVASTRAAGPELAAAAGVAGEEAGAAESEGMAAGLTAGKAKVATAGATSAAEAGAATKAGFLGKMAGRAGEIGLVYMAVSGIFHAVGIQDPVQMVEDLVGEINHYFTGDPLTPAQQAWETDFGKMSNTVREKLGLAKLYSDDGTKKLSDSTGKGADDASTKFTAGVAPIPKAAGDAGTEATRGFKQGVAPLPKDADKAGADTGGGFLAGVKRAWDATNRFLDDKWGGIGRFFASIGPGVTKGAEDMWKGTLDLLHQLPRQFGIGIGQIAAYVVLAAKNIGTNFVKGLTDGWGAVSRFIESIPTGFMTGLSQLGSIASRAASNFGTNFVKGLTDGWGAVSRFIQSIPGGFSIGLSQLGDVAMRAASNFGTNFVKGLTDGAGAIWRFVQSIPKGFMDGLSQLGTLMKAVGKNVIDGIIQGLRDAYGALKDFIGTIGQGIIDGFNGVIQSKSPSKVFHQSGTDIMAGLHNGLSEKQPDVNTKMGDIAKGVVDTANNGFGVRSPSTIFNNIGVNIMVGLWNGLQSWAQRINDWVTGFAQGVINAVRSVLQINSPSLVMHDIGEGFVEGFHNGIVARAPAATKAATTMVQDVNSAVIAQLKVSQAQAADTSWAVMQGWIENGGDIQDSLALKSMQQLQSTPRKNRWGCWVCGKEGHDPLECPNRSAVLTLTRANSGIGVQDSTVQAGVVNNFTIQGTVLDHQGMFQALQEAALRSGQRNSFTGGFGTPR